MKVKVAFYIPNRGFFQRNLENVFMGNPGIGGSEYSAILIASSLSLDSNFDVTLFCDFEGHFPYMLKNKACGCLEKALEYAEKDDFDFIVVDTKFFDEALLVRYRRVNFIAWANCFIDSALQSLFAKFPNVVKIVNVGRHQRELLKDTCIDGKSTYIFNAVPTSFLEKFDSSITPISERKHNVVYIGSLHRAKGFHVLAKAWPEIIKEVPDAQLFVIGSGHLYGGNSKLGRWGVAQEEYEKEFMPYLTNDNMIMQSVHFMGIMGNEKYEILNECKVGVPNPSGVSETFGYTAVEMQLMGCHVTTIKCPGYLDTVCERSCLYDSENELAAKVVSLLQNDFLNYDEIKGFVSRFSLQQITEKWKDLFCDLKKKNGFTPLRIGYNEMIEAFLLIKFRELKCYIKKCLKYNNGKGCL